MKGKLYFKNLDGIRFFAAFLVVLHHAFYFKQEYAPGPSFITHAFHDAGRMGVDLFFVLSGFLISYLLMIEKDSTGTISYKNFYMRRILRIWPLYLGLGLIMTFIGPFVSEKLGIQAHVPWETMLMNLVYLLLFAVNIQLAVQHYSTPGVFEISWSVCIEEQFYLLWPIIVNVFRRRLVTVFIIMLVLRTALWGLCVILPHYYNISYDRLAEIEYLMLFDKLDLFGGGMLMAMLWMRRDNYQSLFKKLFHPAVQWIMVALNFIYIFAVVRPPDDLLFFVDHVICIVLFGYLLLAAVSENSIFNLEQPLLKKLGVISYGIYLFHASICQLVFIAFKKVVQHPGSSLVYDIIYPFTALAVTCTVAYISYEYFEKIFLKKKQAFTLIKTRY